MFCGPVMLRYVMSRTIQVTEGCMLASPVLDNDLSKYSGL